MDTNEKNKEPKLKKPLRLWPGVIMAILLVVLRFIIPAISFDFLFIGIFSALIISALIILWWAFLSRAVVFERLLAIGLMIASLFLTSVSLDKSIATGGQGLMFIIYSIPILSLVFVAWAVITRKMPNKIRRISMMATIIISVGLWAFLRIDGITGDFGLDLAWRWAKTPEEKLLAQGKDMLSPVQLDSAAMISVAEWAGFRGTNRNGIIRGVKIATEWSKNPPVEMWRKPVGSACSSFSVLGNFLYTQEQRGDFEIVSCYNLKTGEAVWRHQDSTRFWDSHAGAGPRSTPTICNGKIYTLGATGILNTLDAFSGKLIWSHNAAADTKVLIPGWGYTSSPLVVDSTVIVAIAGQCLAYDLETGNLRWMGEDGGESYSSPQLILNNGVQQVLFMNAAGTTSYSPNEGNVLWNYPCTGGPIVQPIELTESDILISPGNRQGMKRLSVKNGKNEWKIEERWTSNNFRPYFNDFVIHKDHIYGFDGPNLACIDTQKGERKWKGGRYDGELLLLADQDLLLVLTEKGEVVLVKAEPGEYKELVKFKAIDGKTWNHPVLVGNILVVRNFKEMAAFKLPLASS